MGNEEHRERIGHPEEEEEEVEEVEEEVVEEVKEEVEEEKNGLSGTGWQMLGV